MDINFIKKYDFSIYSPNHKSILKNELLIRFYLREIYKENPKAINKALKKKIGG